LETTLDFVIQLKSLLKIEERHSVAGKAFYRLYFGGLGDGIEKRKRH
jgi:hypothetical protein